MYQEHNLHCIYHRSRTVHYIYYQIKHRGEIISSLQTHSANILYIYISKVELKVPCIYIIIENRVKLIKMHKKLMSTDNLMI